MYVNTETLEQVSRRQIKHQHPDVSLPKEPTGDQLEPLGFAVLHPTDQPEGDVVTQGAPELSDGKWQQTWEARSYTPEELDDVKANAARRVAQQSDSKMSEMQLMGSLASEEKYKEALAGEGEFIEAEAKKLEIPLQEVIDSVLAERTRKRTQAITLESERAFAVRNINTRTSVADINQDSSGFEEALQKVDSSDWIDNPTMEGDIRIDDDGRKWRSRVDYNVWEPPFQWEEIVDDGYPQWELVPGQGYSIGDRVTHNGTDYESNINGNTTEPGTDERWWSPL